MHFQKQITFIVMILSVCIFNFLVLSNQSVSADTKNKKLEFWDTQRKGANGDGGINHDSWFKAAAEFKIEYIRMCAPAFKPNNKDFLVGNADHFTTINEKDFIKLKKILDSAAYHNVKILLTMFSLPGARYRQDNGYKFDYRLWNNESYQKQTKAFWKQLAGKLKNHQAVVGYNPLNEPHPARQHGIESDDTKAFEGWQKKIKDTTADLNRFNRDMVKTIRSVDPETPIVLDGWFHSSPNGLTYLDPVDDQAVLYAFHYYDPWNYVTFRVNKKQYFYSDKMPIGWSGKTESWTINHLIQTISPVNQWAEKHNISKNRIIAEEFGCDRRVKGAKEYLGDLITIFNKNGWHWAFYAFRSSDWNGLDYELGTRNMGQKYWEEREKGVPHEKLINRHTNPLWDVLRKDLLDIN